MFIPQWGMFGFSARRRTYLDHASATPTLPEAVRAVARGYEMSANPGSIHKDGLAAKKMLEHARHTIAHELGVKARQIIFTSGATEGNNLAILGLARAIQLRKIHKSDLCNDTSLTCGFACLQGTHWIVSSIEHDSVLECFAEIERLGGRITHIDPDPRGIIAPEKVARALRPETALVSIGWANNEIGVIQPLRDIARVIRTHNEGRTAALVLLHSDMGQGPLYLAPHMHTLGVDMAVFGSGKLYGPRGIGALYLDNRAEPAPLSFGGSQERGLRAGTETPALAAGFAEALALIGRERHTEGKRLAALREMLAREILACVPGAVVNGALAHALPHMLNISIPDIDTEYLILALDRAGIALSTKSACREGEASRSHAVAALGGEPWRAEHTLRFSLGRGTTARDIASAAAALDSALAAARMR